MARILLRTLSIAACLSLFIPYAIQEAHAQTINSVSPTQIAVGSPSTTLSVIGGGFTNGTVVVLNGSQAVITSFVNANQLQVVIPDFLLTTPGLLRLTISGGLGSAAVTVYSLAPPTIANVLPSVVVRLSTISITFTGKDLIGSSLSVDSPGFQIQSQTGTDSSLVFSVSTGASAMLGSRTVTLSKPNGASSVTKIQVVDGGSWQTLSTPDLVNASVTTLRDGRILIAGGSNVSSSIGGIFSVQPNNWANLIDPMNFSSVNVGPMNVTRSGHQSILLADGRVLVFGGTTSGGATPFAEIFDPQNNSWSPAAYLRNTAATPILLPSGTIFLPPDEIYDPLTQTSITVKGTGHSNYPGYGQKGVLRDDGSVYVTDGTFAVIYDPVADSAQAVPAPGVNVCNPNVSPGLGIPSPCSGTPSLFPDVPILLPDGTIFGSIAYITGSASSIDYYYDPVANLSSISLAFAPGSVKTARLLPTGKLLMFGGFPTGTDASFYPYLVGKSPAVAILDPSKGISPTITPPVSSVGPTALLNDGRLLVGSSALFDGPGGRPLIGPSQAAVYSPEMTTYPAPVANNISVFDSRSNGDLTIKITGSNFLPNSVVTIGTAPLRTIYVGANALFAFVPANTQAQNPNGMITVTNVGPGGGSSTPLPIGASVQPPPPPPIITGVTPVMGAQGATISAMVTGTNLSGVTSVTFSGPGVTATFQPGGTTTQIPITVTIASNATPGPQAIRVTAATGSTTLNSAFTVQRANEPVTAPQPITEVEQGAVHSGYAIITPDQNTATPTPTVTFGMVSGGIIQSQAGTFPGPMATDASLFVDVIPGIGRNLGVALANPGSSTNTVNLTLSDASGAAVSMPVTITLQPQQQLARFVSDLFSASVIGAALQGNLRMQSSSPFAIVGLRFSGTDFCTLPVVANTTNPGVPSRVLTGGSTVNTPMNGTIGGNAAVIVPQFAMGGGWATQIAIVNNNAGTMSGRIDVFDASGNPMAVKLNGATQSTFTYSILAAGAFVLAPRDANGQSPF